MNKLQKADYQQFLEEIKQKVYQAQYQALKAVNKKLIRTSGSMGVKTYGYGFICSAADD